MPSRTLVQSPLPPSPEHKATFPRTPPLTNSSLNSRTISMSLIIRVRISPRPQTRVHEARPIMVKRCHTPHRLIQCISNNFSHHNHKRIPQTHTPRAMACSTNQVTTLPPNLLHPPTLQIYTLPLHTRIPTQIRRIRPLYLQHRIHGRRKYTHPPLEAPVRVLIPSPLPQPCLKIQIPTPHLPPTPTPSQAEPANHQNTHVPHHNPNPNYTRHKLRSESYKLTRAQT